MPEKILNVILFLVYAYGLGTGLTLFLNTLNLELLALRLGLGLAAIPVLGVALNAFKIPLDWWIFFVTAALGAFYAFKKGKASGNPIRIFSPSRPEILLIFIILISVWIYCVGAFQYPWLEDNDPWAHAAGIKFVALERSVTIPSGTFQYINPYPPGYDILFGILHQTSPSLYWTLKFFNGLIISLGFLFFFFFIKEFTQNEKKALWATVFLALIPCYLSHFIWASALAVTLFFPAFTCLLKLRSDRNFILPAAVCISGICLTQPTFSIKFVVLAGVLLIISSVIQKKIYRNVLWAGFLALVISGIWWLPVGRTFFKGSSRMIVNAGSQQEQKVVKTQETIPGLFKPEGGTATRIYEWKDFFFPPRPNFINNPIGIGVVLILFALAGIILILSRWKFAGSPERIYGLTVLSWLVFAFLGVNSATFHLPVGLFAFRFWMILAIPVCLLAAEAFLEMTHKLPERNLRRGLLTVCLGGILWTSGYPKFDVNFSFWDWGTYWTTKAELKGYLWLRRNLTPGTRVFAFTDNQLVIGHDMRSDYWSAGYQKDFRDAFRQDLMVFHHRLKRHKFEYIVIGAREVKRYGLESVNNKIGEMSTSGMFREVANVPEGAAVFKIL